MTLFHDDGQVAFYQGDTRTVLSELPAESVHCVVTSPPYWGLRDYGMGDAQLGLEATPEAYVAAMVDVFREVRRVLRDDGTVWLNLGDSYAGSGKGGGAEGSKQATNKGANSVGTWGNHVGGRAAVESLAVTFLRKQTEIKPKDLVGIPWMVAFALRADGWYLRSDIIWSKPNPMPESVRDRPTKAHEYLFLLSKRERYYYDADAIREANGGGLPWGGQKAEKKALVAQGNTHGPGSIHRPGTRDDMLAFYGNGRNKRTVWTVPTAPYAEAHFATYPPELIKPCILAGCPEGGTVLDPFIGSGTTALVAKRLGRRAIGIDLNPEYLAMAVRRAGGQLMFEAVS